MGVCPSRKCNVKCNQSCHLNHEIPPGNRKYVKLMLLMITLSITNYSRRDKILYTATTTDLSNRISTWQLNIAVNNNVEQSSFKLVSVSCLRSSFRKHLLTTAPPPLPVGHCSCTCLTDQPITLSGQGPPRWRRSLSCIIHYRTDI